MSTYYRTSDLARAVGIHPNTVRLYVDWGLIPPVERSPKGYRRFTEFHLDCIRLARLVYSGFYPGPIIRRSGAQVVLKAASSDLGGALELAYEHHALVKYERAQADAASSLLERWASGVTAEPTGAPLQIGETAQLLGVTIDILRNWERNGLIKVPRNPRNGYRKFSSREISRLRVIRMLSRSGFSTMAILRMLLQLDAGRTERLQEVLDTPGSDEDVFTAADRWISTLNEQESRAIEIISHLEEMIIKYPV